MTNKEIANYFNDLASIMELHKENPFKIRSYKNAYITIRKYPESFMDMDKDSIGQIKGIGKAINDKIEEIKNTQTLNTYQKYLDITPLGVVEMLNIKGLGPSKIRVIWKDLGVESVGELLYACNENRLVSLKGFGEKTQKDVIQKIHFYQNSLNKYHYARILPYAEKLLLEIKEKIGDVACEFVGGLRRKDIIIEEIEILIAKDNIDDIFDDNLILIKKDKNHYMAKLDASLLVNIYTCNENEWGSKYFRYTGTRAFLEAFLEQSEAKDFTNIKEEKLIFENAQLPYIVPECRNDAIYIGKNTDNLIVETDIKGVIHAHSTFSDGMNTLEEMAQACIDKGYEYLGITDHSKSAFYANGLKEDRVEEQWHLIDELNQRFSNFKIFKGIESDILYDGNLDYDEAILKGFDFIIASVHSQLKMDEEKATSRIITAIENPYTTILGHPTGRLLLSRKGYPVNHQKIIDACATNNVAIELNANPLRLDLDYQWIPYAMEKGVKICINPDAHSITGINDIKYGVLAARKGGLTKESLFELK